MVVTCGTNDDGAYRAALAGSGVSPPAQGPAARAGRAGFEREVAAMDLADAAQADARAAMMLEAGLCAESDEQSRFAAALYASADRHGRAADQIETGGG